MKIITNNPVKTPVGNMRWAVSFSPDQGEYLVCAMFMIEDDARAFAKIVKGPHIEVIKIDGIEG